MIPWHDIMKFGLGYLKLPPDAFWRMTLRELDAAIDVTLMNPLNYSVPDVAQLDQLIKTYPDI